MLASFVVAYASPPISWAIAAPSADDPRAAFLAASKTLTGRTTLDAAQADRLYDALSADDPQFPAQVQALGQLIEERKIDPLQLQHVLDAERSALAAVPRKIVTAWYVGVVGEGERARCLTYETSLMNVVTSDKLRPPSYCFGGYGSWAQKPG